MCKRIAEKMNVRNVRRRKWTCEEALKWCIKGLILLLLYSILMIIMLCGAGSAGSKLWKGDIPLWNVLRRSRPVIWLRALRTAAAASARLPASLHARPLVVLPISCARIRASNHCTERRGCRNDHSHRKDQRRPLFFEFPDRFIRLARHPFQPQRLHKDYIKIIQRLSLIHIFWDHRAILERLSVETIWF